MSQAPKGTAMLGRDLAAEARIPPNYLAKILVALRHAGMVTAARGSGGGYGLSKRPQKIRLIDVVELFEGPRSRPHCLLGEDHDCSDETPCAAHATYRKVRQAHLRFLEGTTIAAIAEAGARKSSKEKKGP
jgi:Rrf2 family protein